MVSIVSKYEKLIKFMLYKIIKSFLSKLALYYIRKIIQIEMDPQHTNIFNGTETTRLDLEGVDESLHLELILKEAAEKHLGMTYEQLLHFLDDKLVDRLLGCMFGAFLADSLGSFCEFQSKGKCTQVSQLTMTMPGGGPFQLLPGQVTDDSQMALHMLQGLLNYDPKISLEAQIPKLLVSIAREYVQWITNIPFDIGFTTRAALVQLEHYLSKPGKDIEQDYQKLHEAYAQIKNANQKSLSNGFLMRLTPMVCFATLLTKQSQQNLEFIPKLVQKQVNLTHTNTVCISAANIYLELLRSMILRGSHEDISKVYKTFVQKFRNTSDENIVGSAIEQAFIIHQQQDKDLYAADGRNAGFFKIAYFYTFYALRQIAANCKTEKQLTSQIYKNVIQFTIAQGGDTDTNACIVGGFVGSVVGFKNLPAEYLVKHLNLKLGQSPYRLNEKTYEPINGFVNIIKLIRKFN